MNLYIDRDAYHHSFDEVGAAAAFASSGSLRLDVQRMAELVAIAAKESAFEIPLGRVLSADDPMRSIKEIAASLLLLNTELRHLGFAPPTTTWRQDPIGFLVYNAEFLASIAPIVVDPPRIIH